MARINLRRIFRNALLLQLLQQKLFRKPSDNNNQAEPVRLVNLRKKPFQSQERGLVQLLPLRQIIKPRWCGLGKQGNLLLIVDRIRCPHHLLTLGLLQKDEVCLHHQY